MLLVVVKPYTTPQTVTVADLHKQALPATSMPVNVQFVRKKRLHDVMLIVGH